MMAASASQAANARHPTKANLRFWIKVAWVRQLTEIILNLKVFFSFSNSPFCELQRAAWGIKLLIYSEFGLRLDRCALTPCGKRPLRLIMSQTQKDVYAPPRLCNTFLWGPCFHLGFCQYQVRNTSGPKSHWNLHNQNQTAWPHKRYLRSTLQVDIDVHCEYTSLYS